MIWIIQEGQNSTEKWIKALTDNGSNFKTIKIIPFDDNLAHVETGDEAVVVYGTTTLIKNASKNWKPGSFFNVENFKCSTWLKAYGDHCFNSDNRICKLKDLLTDCPDECFIRPNNDLKDFSGVIVKKENLMDQIANIQKGGFLFDDNLEVLIAPIKHIQKEWRFFIIDGKVVTGSQYKLKSMVILDSKIEQRVIDFAQSMANIWSPEKAFVMDICLNNQDELKVLELNCFNGSGTYLCDIPKIIQAIEALDLKKD